MLIQFIEKKAYNEVPEMKLNYTLPANKDIFTSRFTMDYLLKIMNLLNSNICEDSIMIKVAQDYPLMIENTHFIVILAPRVDT